MRDRQDLEIEPAQPTAEENHRQGDHGVPDGSGSETAMGNRPIAERVTYPPGREPSHAVQNETEKQVQDMSIDEREVIGPSVPETACRFHLPGDMVWLLAQTYV